MYKIAPKIFDDTPEAQRNAIYLASRQAAWGTRRHGESRLPDLDDFNEETFKKLLGYGSRANIQNQKKSAD